MGGGGGGGGPEVELTTKRALYGFYGSTVTNTTKEASQQTHNVATMSLQRHDVAATL